MVAAPMVERDCYPTLCWVGCAGNPRLRTRERDPMTQPATYWEGLTTTALRFAREQIELSRRPGGIFHPDAEREYGRVLMKSFILTHPFGADGIVYMAEKGSSEADVALREIIA